ncbi:hypothetical protein D4R86_03085, partial [bacterium]
MVVTVASDNPKYFDMAHRDYNYIENMMVLASSVLSHNPNETMQLYVVNYTKGLTTNNKNIVVTNLKKEGTNMEIRNYAAHLRAEIILNEFLKGTKEVIWMDSDIIVRGNLQFLYVNSDTPTIKILTRKAERDELQFQSAVFSLNNTNQTIEMLKDWVEFIEENKSMWFADQLGLYKMCIKHNIKIVDIGSKYNDQFLNSESVIWHCKGNHR